MGHYAIAVVRPKENPRSLEEVLWNHRRKFDYWDLENDGWDGLWGYRVGEGPVDLDQVPEEVPAGDPEATPYAVVGPDGTWEEAGRDEGWDAHVMRDIVAPLRGKGYTVDIVDCHI